MQALHKFFTGVVPLSTGQFFLTSAIASLAMACIIFGAAAGYNWLLVLGSLAFAGAMAVIFIDLHR